ncbi:hypothetical protein M433DRAFT_130219 [Acidomyces richmondensis BFW]|nr:MAG: hypothetical protein FE78DRAFT_71143 [Acidomyces sp. 'richmondensis']KYG50566.1 hypothetical protein M433DRAFT_130219 [Acidomyces richmondensis BFW]
MCPLGLSASWYNPRGKLRTLDLRLRARFIFENGGRSRPVIAAVRPNPYRHIIKSCCHGCRAGRTRRLIPTYRRSRHGAEGGHRTGHADEEHSCPAGSALNGRDSLRRRFRGADLVALALDPEPRGRDEDRVLRVSWRRWALPGTPAEEFHLDNHLRTRFARRMSKFVEILDVADAPYSHENVTLEDTLAENRRRSESSSSASSSSDKSSAREQSPTTPPHSPVKTRLRAFSLRKAKT